MTHTGFGKKKRWTTWVCGHRNRRGCRMPGVAAADCVYSHIVWKIDEQRKVLKQQQWRVLPLPAASATRLCLAHRAPRQQSAFQTKQLMWFAVGSGLMGQPAGPPVPRGIFLAAFLKVSELTAQSWRDAGDVSLCSAVCEPRRVAGFSLAALVLMSLELVWSYFFKKLKIDLFRFFVTFYMYQTYAGVKIVFLSQWCYTHTE